LALNSGRFGCQARGALIDVGEGPQVGQLHHHEERLLEGVVDLLGFVEQAAQHLDLLRCRERPVHALADVHRVRWRIQPSSAALCSRFSDKALCRFISV
jgi:hypothetical protein